MNCLDSFFTNTSLQKKQKKKYKASFKVKKKDMKRIKYNPNQTKDNYFRLENYKDDDGLQFQRFSLPTKKNETRYGFRFVSVWE